MENIEEKLNLILAKLTELNEKMESLIDKNSAWKCGLMKTKV